MGKKTNPGAKPANTSKTSTSNSTSPKTSAKESSTSTTSKKTTTDTDTNPTTADADAKQRLEVPEQIAYHSATIDAATLLAFHDEDPLDIIDGVFHGGAWEGLRQSGRGEAFGICGDDEIAKSSLASQIAVCVASGRPFLGRVTNRGKVLYINPGDEVRNCTLAEKLRNVCAALKIDPEALRDHLLVANSQSLAQIDRSKCLEAAFEECLSKGCDLAVIDAPDLIDLEDDKDKMCSLIFDLTRFHNLNVCVVCPASNVEALIGDDTAEGFFDTALAVRNLSPKSRSGEGRFEVEAVLADIPKMESGEMKMGAFHMTFQTDFDGRTFRVTDEAPTTKQTWTSYNRTSADGKAKTDTNA